MGNLLSGTDELVIIATRNLTLGGQEIIFNTQKIKVMRDPPRPG
jgi:hypothetical protein